MSLLDALDQLVQAVQPEEDPAVDLLLASAVAREAITFELISGSNRHFGCSYKQEELLSHLRSQWRRAAKERDFENMALALIQKCTAAGKLSVRGWSDETEEVTLSFIPPQSQGLPDFRLTLHLYTDKEQAKTSIFRIALLAVQQGKQQVKALKESSRSELDAVRKELNASKRKISNLQQDLSEAHQQPQASTSASAELVPPFQSQESRRSSATPSPTKPVKMRKGPLDFGRTGGRVVKRNKDFESESSEEDEPDKKRSKS